MKEHQDLVQLTNYVVLGFLLLCSVFAAAMVVLAVSFRKRGVK